MAGIDNNTLLYLRGDSFNDLSNYNHSIINSSGILTSLGGVYGSYIDLTSNGKKLIVEGLKLPNQMFTIDWWELNRGNNSTTTSTSLITNLSMADTAIKSFTIGKAGSSNIPIMSAAYDTSAWEIASEQIGNVNTTDWVHRAVVFDGSSFTIYENGMKYKTIASGGIYNLDTDMIIGTLRENTNCYNAYVSGLRLSDNVRWTSDFTVPSQPYTSVSIDNVNIENNTITFNVSKLSTNESINKVDILLNGEITQLYNENFNNISYNIDNSLCIYGKNNVEIRAYYYDDYYESVGLEYHNVIDKLPAQPSLPQLVEKINEVKNVYNGAVNALYNILNEQGVSLDEKEKGISYLINKVDKFTENLKHDLVNALIDRRIENISTENSFNELIGEIDNITDFPKWCVTSGGYWITGANMTTSRRYLSSGVIDTSIYCVGGYTGSSSSVNQRYDTLTNTWTAMTAVTAARYGHAVAASKGKLYCMGGYSTYTTNYCYDPTTNAWTTMTAIPASSYYSATAEVGGIIYLISGYVGGSLSTTNRTYDVNTNTWSTINTLPAAVYSPSVGVYKNKIYVVGGYNSGAKTTNYCYDITTGNWTTLKAKTNTVYRAGQVAPVIDGKLYVIGGTGSATYSAVNECYDIENDTWSTLTALPTGSYALTTQVVDGFIYCIGGYTGSYSNANHCFLLL